MTHNLILETKYFDDNYEMIMTDLIVWVVIIIYVAIFKRYNL